MGKRNLSSRTHGPLYKPRYWLAWLVVAFLWLLGQIPVRFRSRISSSLARRLINSKSRRTRTIRRNISLCFPDLSEQDQSKLAEQNLAATLACFFDFLDLVWKPAGYFNDQCDVIGEEHLHRAIASGKPLLIVTGHFLSLVPSVIKLASLIPFNVVYRRMDNPVLQSQLFGRVIKKNNITAIHRKEIPHMLKTLKDQGVVLILPDQDFGTKRSTFVPFFGVSTATITSIPQYATATGANVLVFRSTRSGERSRMEIEPVLENFPSGDDQVDTQRWSDWLEDSIQQQPEDYLWLHKRFKTHPSGEAKRY